MGKKDVDGQIQEVEAEIASGAAPQAETAPDKTTAGADKPVASADEPVAAEAAGAHPVAEEAADIAAQVTLDLQQTKDQLLRQAAEFQNYRRRIEKERTEWVRRGQIQVIEPMLAVLDDFRRSLDMLEQQGDQQEAPGPAYLVLKEGVELVYQNFSNALKKMGVEYIEAVGHPFDVHLHEALMQMPAPEGTPPGTVLDEIQRGYRLGDRVLRHSGVVVAA